MTKAFVSSNELRTDSSDIHAVRCDTRDCERMDLRYIEDQEGKGVVPDLRITDEATWSQT